MWPSLDGVMTLLHGQSQLLRKANRSTGRYNTRKNVTDHGNLQTCMQLAQAQNTGINCHFKQQIHWLKAKNCLCQVITMADLSPITILHSSSPEVACVLSLLEMPISGAVARQSLLADTVGLTALLRFCAGFHTGKETRFWMPSQQGWSQPRSDVSASLLPVIHSPAEESTQQCVYSKNMNQSSTRQNGASYLKLVNNNRNSSTSTDTVKQWSSPCSETVQHRHCQ